MKTVFFDVDTQLDFLFPAGALTVPGAERIVSALTALTKFAAVNDIQIISTADAHTEDDPEFKIWKPHCVVGTVGQIKASATLLNRTLVFPPSDQVSEFTAVLPRQLLIEKRSIDCFSNANLRPLLSAIGAERYVVYGVATEHCVQRALIGLLSTGARVELVEDAICGIDPAQIENTLSRFANAGGKLTTVSQVSI